MQKMTKTAVITGASRGIGREIALTFAEMGYRTILMATNKKSLQEVAQCITQTHQLNREQEPLVFALNVADSKQVEQAVLQTMAITKRVDVLVNSAGIYRVGTTEISEEEFLEMLKVNLFGCFNLIHAIAPWMKKQRSGYIFNIASRAGKIASGTSGGYAASKFGLVGLNEALFNELSKYGIKITAICPSYVDTDMAAKSPLTKAEKIPIDDICKTIRFLLELAPNTCVKDLVIECRNWGCWNN